MLNNKMASNLNMHCNSELLYSDSTSIDNYHELLGKCKYINPGRRTVLNAKINDSAVIQNIRSLQKHSYEDGNYLRNKKPEIVTFSEAKLQDGKITRSIELEGDIILFIRIVSPRLEECGCTFINLNCSALIICNSVSRYRMLNICGLKLNSEKF